ARAASLLRARLERSRGALAGAAGRLEAVSPLSVLSRGYAIAYSLRGRKRPILDATAVALGESIEVRLRRGSLGCTVDSVMAEAGEDPGTAGRDQHGAPPARSGDDDGTKPRE
ncbi:MAG: hypothetical protein NDJ92_06930, partial [Thermoanaerobaculia bacterium]|nr:hypothetical protein [Thermoanaerobaculia bacterium]